MSEKIDEELFKVQSANFLPQYPINGWPIFQGLFTTFYTALDDLCEFQAHNVLYCGVGKRVKNILRTLKRYLSGMGLITWSHDVFKSWFESQERKSEFGKSQKICWKSNKKQQGQTQYTNKKKRQTDAFRETLGTKPNLETLQQVPEDSNTKMSSAHHGNNKGTKKAKGKSQCDPIKASSTHPLKCGQCWRQYKNIRSYITHMYQVHNKKVPEGSTHSLNGEPFVRAVPLKTNPSTKPDQFTQPRQDFQQPSSGPSQRDSEMIEETPQGNIVHGQKASPTHASPLPIPPKGKKKGKT